MIFCMGKPCAHMDEQTNACTFTGNCIVKKYNMNEQQLVRAQAALDVTPQVTEQVNVEQFVFNPFQRGNGCTLAGYTLADIVAAHVR